MGNGTGIIALHYGPSLVLAPQARNQTDEPQPSLFPFIRACSYSDIGHAAPFPRRACKWLQLTGFYLSYMRQNTNLKICLSYSIQELTALTQNTVRE